ncbi:MAG: sugar transferase [Flavobacteriales bacterium]|nr:sugar transferase [Flavobacteriales bacterium]
MERRIELDVWYLENWSFLLDLRIVIETVTNMLGKDPNAY